MIFMSKDLTKRAVELLLNGATMLSDPCPYCKGVRILKDGNALCISCGREADQKKLESVSISSNYLTSTNDNLDRKINDLAKELQNETNSEKQKEILHSINEIIAIKEKLAKI